MASMMKSLWHSCCAMVNFFFSNSKTFPKLLCCCCLENRFNRIVACKKTQWNFVNKQRKEKIGFFNRYMFVFSFLAIRTMLRKRIVDRAIDGVCWIATFLRQQRHLPRQQQHRSILVRWYFHDEMSNIKTNCELYRRCVARCCGWRTYDSTRWLNRSHRRIY